MFQLRSASYKALIHFKNVPPIIEPSKIHIVTDLKYLLDLENNYDRFLETNLDLLDIYNIIDELIDIRDTITLQISRLRRKKQLQDYYYYYYNNNNININNNKKDYSHSHSHSHSTSLNLTKSQKNQGYILCQNSLKIYKCGCKTIQYEIPNQKQRQKPVIQKQKYCPKHLQCLKMKAILEEELTNITKKENLR
jgi:hypothetical protein